jgi:hypothetical protein
VTKSQKQDTLSKLLDGKIGALAFVILGVLLSVSKIFKFGFKLLMERRIKRLMGL